MKTVAYLWDGQQLKCDFRRTFTTSMMDMWFEIVEIARAIKSLQRRTNLFGNMNLMGFILPNLYML
jgi:hypothetical protein